MYFSNKDYRIGPMSSHDCIYFVIHMDAAQKEMKAASCFEIIIEFNSQLDTAKLIVGDPRLLLSTEEMGLVRRLAREPRSGRYNHRKLRKII